MDPLNSIADLFGQTIASEFAHTAAIFALAAWVHGRQVRSEIKTQFSELVGVLKDDLAAIREAQGTMHNRVTLLEERLK